MDENAPLPSTDGHGDGPSRFDVFARFMSTENGSGTSFSLSWFVQCETTETSIDFTYCDYRWLLPLFSQATDWVVNRANACRLF